MSAYDVVDAYAPEVATFLENHYDDFLVFIGDEKDANSIISALKTLDGKEEEDDYYS